MAGHRLGSWQKQIANRLLAGEEVANPVGQLRGKAKSYAGKYNRSFLAVLAYLRSQGYEIIVIPGQKGGISSACYRLGLMIHQQPIN